jgi:hypothetical protein
VTNQLADIEEAVLLGCEAVELTPPPHPDRSLALRNLATFLSNRFDKTGQIADKEEADLLEREALELDSASDSSR